MPRELTRSLAALSALLLGAGAASAQAPAALDFSGYASAWRQDCASGCSLPVASGPAAAAAFRIGVPSSPGEARTAKFEREFVLAPAGERVTASVVVYFVCPRGAAPDAWSDSCPSRYLQVQIALTGDASAFCAASLNPADAHPFPVMMCAGENRRRPGERLGVSLSRLPTLSL